MLLLDGEHVHKQGLWCLSVEMEGRLMKLLDLGEFERKIHIVHFHIFHLLAVGPQHLEIIVKK